MNYQKKIFIYLLIFLTASSYFLGFYLNENAAGAGFYSGDLGHVWKNVQIYLNNETIKSINHPEIYSNRPPLLYLLHKYLNPLTTNIETFRLSVFLISIISPILFFYCLIKKFDKTNKILLAVIAVTILLSPYYRTSGFWGLEENFGIISVLIAIIFFLDYEKNNSNKNLFLLIFFSSLCVYFDQKLLVVPLIFFIKIFFSNQKFGKKMTLTLLYLLFSIPYFYLIFTWKGIFPPSHNELHNFNIVLWDNLIFSITIMSIYFIPFIFFNKDFMLHIKKMLVNKIFFASIVFILFFIFYLEFFYVRPEFDFHSNFDGGGAIRKLFLILFENSMLQKTFLFLSALFLWPTIFLFSRKDNFYIILYFLILSLFIYPLYQETFDPIMLLLIVFFFLKEPKIKFENVVFVNLYFATFLLCSIFYYN